MNDRTNDRGGGKGRPPSRGGAGGGKSFGPRSGGPGKGRGGDDRPARGPRPEGDARPRRFDGDRPARPDRPATGGRPQRSDRPQGGERLFRGKPEGGERKSYGGPRPAPRGDAKGRPPRKAPEREAAPRKEFSERIAKVIARAGLCSRRDAEAWIEAGRVEVNGVTLTSPALDVNANDKIVVDGAPLPTRERTRLFMFHKPRGVVTTVRDPEGRRTVFDALPPGLPRVITIGRLDINTEGLLLLTNDGGLARVLSLPETGWLRRYRVRAFGEITQPQLDALRDGVTIEGMHYGPVEATLDRAQGDNAWLTLGLREGKNREVKKILEYLGLQVNRLIRLSFGPFQLGDLPEGAAEEVPTRVLQDQLGVDLAAQAEVDFEAPVFVYDEDDFRPKAKTPRDAVTGDDRPKRRTRDEAPAWGAERDDRRGRGRFGEAEGDEKPRPKRRHPMEQLTSIWRADDAEANVPRGKIPRRGADPKLARTESAEKVRSRAGKVTDPKGRAVKVERIKVDPAAFEREAAREDRPQRRGPARPRDEAPRDERPFRARAEGDRPERRERPAGDRPERRDRPAGERGERRSFGDRPAGGPKRSFGGDRAGSGEKRGFAPRERDERPRGGGDDRPKRDLWFEGRKAEGEGGARKPRTFKPREDRGGEGFKPRGERPSERTGDRAGPRSKPRGERSEGGFKARGDRPSGPGGSRGGPGGSRGGPGGKPGGFSKGPGRGGSGPGRGGPGGSGGRPPRRPREG